MTDRTRRFEDALSDMLVTFRSHQERLLVRLPKQVLSMTMREFGDVYNGDVKACLRGLQRDKHAPGLESITPSLRKR